MTKAPSDNRHADASPANNAAAASERGSNAPSIWSAAFIALVITNFVQSVGTFMGVTVIPLYARDLGAAASVIGFITGSFAITALAVRPFSGPAFDSFSKKKLFLVAMALCLVASVGYGLSTSVAALFFFRLVHGIGFGCAGPLGLALAGEVLPQSRLSSGIGFFTISTAASQAIGPAIGIELSRLVGYAGSFYISALFPVVGIVLLALFVKDDPHAVRPPYQIRLNRIFAARAVPSAAVLFLLSISFACVGSFMAIYGELQGVSQIGLYFTIYAICLVATRPLFGKLAEKFGTTKVAIPAMCCFAASFVIISQSHTLPAFIVAALVAGCGFGATTPMMQALMFKCVPHKYRGAGSNTTYTGQDLGNLVGPYAGGLVVESLAPALGGEVAAYSAMWLVMIVPIAAGLVAYLALRPRMARYVAENTTD